MSANERESSVTESDVPWSEDEGDESDSDNDVTNDLGNKGVSKLTAAEKRFMAEVWLTKNILPNYVTVVS